MGYRYEATSIPGFIQQLAVGYVGRGYFFYVLGHVPEGKDPRRVDEKLIAKYGIAISKATRARRKALGYANLQYLRYQDTFLLLATEGKHEFFLEEAGQVRDVRKVPIKLFGYAVSYRGGHPHVRIEQGQYLELKSYFAEVAVHRKKEALERGLRFLHFEPYAPVRSQLHGILREVNRKRKAAGFDPLPSSCLRTRRRILKPFGDSKESVQQPVGPLANPEEDCEAALCTRRQW